MPYLAPSGWLEPVSGRSAGERDTDVFHRRRDCPQIADPDAVRSTDRPYGSLRCPVCGRAD